MGATTKPKRPITCPSCGKQFQSSIVGANAKCSGTRDKPCGKTIYIRADGTYGDTDDQTDPPTGTATADNGDHDDDTDPPSDQAPEVPRYEYADPPQERTRRRKPTTAPTGGGPDVPSPGGGSPGAAGGGGHAPNRGTDDRPDTAKPSRIRRALAAVRRRRGTGHHPYPYGDLFGDPGPK